MVKMRESSNYIYSLGESENPFFFSRSLYGYCHILGSFRILPAIYLSCVLIPFAGDIQEPYLLYRRNILLFIFRGLYSIFVRLWIKPLCFKYIFFGSGFIHLTDNGFDVMRHYSYLGVYSRGTVTSSSNRSIDVSAYKMLVMYGNLAL